MNIKDKILAELGELQSNARLNPKAYITALIAKGIVEKHFKQANGGGVLSFEYDDITVDRMADAQRKVFEAIKNSPLNTGEKPTATEASIEVNTTDEFCTRMESEIERVDTNRKNQHGEDFIVNPAYWRGAKAAYKHAIETHKKLSPITPQPAPTGLLEWLEKTIAQSERTAKDTCEDAYDITERGARENTLRLVIDKVRELGEAKPEMRELNIKTYKERPARNTYVVFWNKDRAYAGIYIRGEFVYASPMGYTLRLVSPDKWCYAVDIFKDPDTE